MKKLYLMRHGQTLFNKLGKVQGASDSPLTEDGIKQAKVAKAFFKDNKIKLDNFYSSTQERASDTLELIIGDAEYYRKKGLKEWNFGLFEGESERLNPQRPVGETSFGNSFVPYGGESAQEVQERMIVTLTEIMDESNNTLAVSHGGAMYLFLQKWLPYEDVKKIRFSNCCILEFDYEAKTFYFKQAIKHSF